MLDVSHLTGNASGMLYFRKKWVYHILLCSFNNKNNKKAKEGGSLSLGFSREYCFCLWKGSSSMIASERQTILVLYKAPGLEEVYP